MKMTFTFTYDYLPQFFILEDWGSNMSNVTDPKNLPDKIKKNIAKGTTDSRVELGWPK